MFVEVIVKNLPYVGKLGTQKEIRDPEARVLIKLGKVKKAEAKPRRVYKRRDVKPQQKVVVEPEISIEPEEVPEAVEIVFPEDDSE